jgi:hypothetical protein
MDGFHYDCGPYFGTSAYFDTSASSVQRMLSNRRSVLRQVQQPYIDKLSSHARFNQPSGKYGNVPVSTKMSPLCGFYNSLFLIFIIYSLFQLLFLMGLRPEC